MGLTFSPSPPYGGSMIEHVPDGTASGTRFECVLGPTHPPWSSQVARFSDEVPPLLLLSQLFDYGRWVR
jgi:hypothetical protein